MHAALMWVATLCQTPAFVIPNTKLAAQVVADYPSLRIVTHDIERVRILREWAWGRCNSPSGGQGAHEVIDAHFWNNVGNAEELFAILETRTGGVMCGGAAQALRRLYEHFGYRAWYLGSAQINGTGDAATLVEITHNGNTFIVFQSAQWNIEMAAPSGHPLDYLEFLSRLRTREHHAITVLEPDWRFAPRHPSVIVPPQYVSMSLADLVKGGNNVMVNHNSVEILPDGTQVVTSPRTWSNYIAKKLIDASGQPTGLMQDIIDAGYPANLVYWYANPNVISGPNQSELLARAKAAAGIQ